MGYDIRLVKNGETVQLLCNVDIGGSVYPVGGTDVAEYATTYNYAGLFKESLQEENGIRSLNGKTAGETISVLEAAIDRLSDEHLGPTIKELREEEENLLKTARALDKAPSQKIWAGLTDARLKDVQERLSKADYKTGRVKANYWDATPFNAKNALKAMLVLAKLAPADSVWEID